MAAAPAWLPDLKVEIGLSGTATDPTQLYNTALYDTALYSDQWTMVDVTQWVISASTQRGFDRSGRLQVGQAIVALDNTDRRFSPANASSPYAGNVKAWRPARVSSPSYAAAGVLTGWVQLWSDDDQLIAGACTCTVTIVDAVGVLAATDVRGVALPSEVVGDRINRLAALSGLTINVVGAGTGALLQASTADGTALDQATKAVLADGGILYVDASGQLVFIARTTIGGLYLSANWRMGDATSAPYRYRAITWEFDGTWVANRVTANRLGGAQTIQTDEAEVAASGLRTPPPDTLKDTLNANDSDVADLALYRLGRSSKPIHAPSQVVLDTMTVDVDQRALAGVELNDRVDVTRTFPGASSPLIQPTAVRTIRHDANGLDGTWRTTLDLLALPGWLTTPPLYDTAVYDVGVYA